MIRSTTSFLTIVFILISGSLSYTQTDYSQKESKQIRKFNYFDFKQAYEKKVQSNANRDFKGRKFQQRLLWEYEKYLCFA